MNLILAMILSWELQRPTGGGVLTPGLLHSLGTLTLGNQIFYKEAFFPGFFPNFFLLKLYFLEEL